MRKIAILIGIEKYRYLSYLPTADAGTRAIESVLISRLGFQANEIIVVNYRDIYKYNNCNGNQLKAYLANLRLDAEYDLVIIYISGYGFIDPRTQERYLADYCTQEHDLIQTGVELKWLDEWVECISASDKLLLIDAGWKLPTMQNVADPGYPLQSNPVLPIRNRQFFTLYSSSEGESSWKLSSSQPTVFTEYLVLGLKFRFFSAFDLFKFVCSQTQEAVQRELSNGQTPYFNMSGGTDILLTDLKRQQCIRRRKYYRIRSFWKSLQSRALTIVAIFIVLLIAGLIAFPDYSRRFALILDDKVNRFIGEKIEQIQIVAQTKTPNETADETLAKVSVETDGTANDSFVHSADEESVNSANGTTDEVSVEKNETADETTDEESVNSADEGTDEETDETPVESPAQTPVEAKIESAVGTAVNTQPIEPEVARTLGGNTENKPVNTTVERPIETTENTQPNKPEVAQAPPAILGPVITQPIAQNPRRTTNGPNPQTGTAASPNSKPSDGSQDFIWYDSPQDRAPSMPRNFPKTTDFGAR